MTLLVDPPALPETAAPIGADGPLPDAAPAPSPAPHEPGAWRPRTSASAVADALVAARLPAPRPATS